MNFAFAAAHVRQRSRAYLGRPCCLLRPAASEARPHCIGLPPCSNHRSTAVPASSGCSLARRQRSPAPPPAKPGPVACTGPAVCTGPAACTAPAVLPGPATCTGSLPGPAACTGPAACPARSLPCPQPAPDPLPAPAPLLARPRCPVRSRHWLAPAPLTGLAAREAPAPPPAKRKNEQ